MMQMYNKAKETGATHYAAAAQVLRSYGFLMMVDMYGEMPYFEVVSGSVHPTYDTGETIYTECLKNIDEAIELFNRSGAQRCCSQVLLNLAKATAGMVAT